MNGFSILFLLVILLLIVIFIVGLSLLIYGLLKKDNKNSFRKKGLIFISIPLSIYLLVLLYSFAHEMFTKKPNKKDLVGIYHISEASNLIPKKLYSSYTLEFKDDGTFYLSTTPGISICSDGKYSVDYQFELNEISFECNGNFTTAHIDRGFWDYRIEFIKGDPDEKESIYFLKNK